ncbi:MAG: NAD(P)/FAD-dependent oxidoreductase [Victivallaceae bacterium]
MKYDCVIIGAGLSGLAAGIRLARYDKKVCICEQHSVIGGLNSYYQRPGALLETGLHAMTNYATALSNKNLPLPKLMRQLKITFDELKARPQNYSLIKFPDKTLRFDNKFINFASSIAENFPADIDGFLKLDEYLERYNEVNLDNQFASAKKIISDFIKNQELIDMLLCPLMYYGSSTENDMDFSQFAIMYQSIFRQGFFRPGGGIKNLLDALKRRFVENGGTLKLKTKIARIITEKNRTTGVETSNGEIIACDNVLSCAGAPETASLCKKTILDDISPGTLAFIETIAMPYRAANSPDAQASIIFFNRTPEFNYRKPENLIDPNSGVICFPQNFQFETGDTVPDKSVRTTVLANSEQWLKMPIEQYKTAKENITKEIFKITEEITGIKAVAEHARLTDSFTPKTIQRYTGRINGAIYGSPVKHKDGKTGLDNLYLCGTDQGFLGITGSLLSGISIANLYLLK